MVFELKGKVVFFATGNINKFNKARHVLSEYKIAVGMVKTKALEIQSDSLEEIAKTSVLDAFKNISLPLIVEDAGLFVEALNGFPGPYAAYVYKTVGNEGLLKLMETVTSRKARFQSSVAYLAPGLRMPVCFSGYADGEVTTREQKIERISGFGFDPIFKPQGSSKTFAEMSIADKNAFSHRAKALRKFGEWYKRSA